LEIVGKATNLTGESLKVLFKCGRLIILENGNLKSDEKIFTKHRQAKRILRSISSRQESL